MFVGIIICSVPPFLADIFKKPGWRISKPDPILLDPEDDPGTGEAAAPTVGAL
jgi:hypothetical protein